MAVNSVRGMTIGSPEFVAVVKAAEREGEITDLIGGMESKLDRITDLLRHAGDLTHRQVSDLRRIQRDLSEVIYG